MSARKPLRMVSMCSGIGGAEVALGPVGYTPVACSEVDPFASAVLAHRFPDVVNEGDLTKADWKKYRGAIDIAVGGFCCQSYSRAGARKGLEDPRGELMLKFLVACRDTGCRWILAENVPNLLSIHGGEDFKTFLETVAELWPGGGVAWRVFNSLGFGIPQRRRRLYVIINTVDPRLAGEVFDESDSLQGDSGAGDEKGTEPATRVDGSDSGEGAGVICMASDATNAEITYDFAPTLLARQYKGPPFVLYGDVLRRLTPDETEMLQGFHRGWTRIPWKGKPAEKCPDLHRYRCTGNAFCVPVIRWIGERIQRVNALSSSMGE